MKTVQYNSGIIKNPQFFSDVYAYYIRGGYFVILVENLLNILTTATTLVFITFVSFFLNWTAIGKCQSVDTCMNVSEYIVYPTNFHNITTNAFMFVFVIMFAIYWMWTTIGLMIDLARYLKIRNYFKVIGIRTDEIKVLTWLDIVKKMMEHDNKLTAEIIVGSVMNKDNYLIAIVGSNLFRMNPTYYTQAFLWLLNVGVLNRIFNDSDGTEKKIIIDTKKITNIMRALAILQLCLLPFTFTLIIVHYIINLTTDIYTSKSYFGPKEWSIYAKLLFREYNELHHVFNERIAKSYKYASRYEQKFNAHMTNVLMEKLIYTVGTCLTLLVFLTFYDERLVLYIRLFNRNLIWYVAILTTCVTLARSLMVNPSSVDESSEEIMKKIAVHTHFFPIKWEGKCHQHVVLEDFKSLFKYKITSIFLEISSIFVMPYYLLKDLSNDDMNDGIYKDIQLVADFIENNTVYCEGIGHICKAGLSNNLSIYSSIDDRYNNEYNLLIEDDKIARSVKNFNEYYHGMSTTPDIETGNVRMDGTLLQSVPRYQLNPIMVPPVKPVISNIKIKSSLTESEEDAKL